MIVIETFYYGDFEGENLQELRAKVVKTLFENSADNLKIDAIKVDGNYLEESLVYEIKWESLEDLLAYRKKGELESLGYLKAQIEC